MSASHILIFCAITAVVAMPVAAQQVPITDPAALADAVIAADNAATTALAATDDIMAEERVVGTRGGFDGLASVALRHFAQPLSVQFEEGSAQLTAAARRFLDDFVAGLLQKAYKGNAVLGIVGHTSKSGSAITNLKLSQARADSVANYINDRLDGRVAARIKAIGYGYQRLLPGVSPQSPLNRRVVLTVGNPGG